MEIDKDKLKENAEKVKQQGAELGKSLVWGFKTLIGGKDSMAMLCDGLLNQGDVGRKYAAAMIEKNITKKDVQAIPFLIEALGDSEPFVASKAATTLGKFGQVASFAIFALKNCAEAAVSEEVRDAANAAIGLIGNEVSAGFPEAVESLKHKSPFVRRYATDLIASLGLAARNAVPALKEAVQDNDPSVRSGAIRALARMGRHAAPAASVIVERLTIDDSIEVKHEAVSALIALGSGVPGVKEALIETATGYDKNLSEYALSNLGKLGEDALPVLVKALKEGTAAQKRKAAASLGDMGPAGKDAISALTACLTAEDVLLRGIAKNSLSKIRGR